MSGKNLNVLVIEDSEADAEINIRMLRTGGYNVTYRRIETGEEMQAALEQTSWDIILSDYSMPRFSVQSALEIYHAHGTDIPFIVISGMIGEEKAVELIKSGVHDYLLKGKMSRFIPVVERELREAVNRRELIKLNTSLAISEQKYKDYIDHAPDGVFIIDETGKYIEVNPAACRMTGYSKEQLLEMSFSDFLPEESREDGMAHLRKLVSTGSSQADLMFRDKHGKTRWMVLEAVKLSETRFLGFAKDISQRKEMEENLRTHQVELEMQNEELLQANIKIEIASQKYTELYDFAPSAYFTLSKEKAIEELNHSGARMLGSERSRLMNLHFDDFVSKKTRHSFNAFFQAVLKTKTKQICEIIIEAGGGQPANVHIEGIVFANEQQCLLNVIDITRRIQTERLLQQTQQNFETFFNAIDDFLFVIDVQGNIVHANKTVTDRLGYEHEELFGNSMLMVHPPELRIEAARIIDEMLLGVTAFCPIPIMTKSGIHIAVETKVSKGYWDGKPVIFGVSKDITQIKLSEEKFSKVFYLNPSACGLSDYVTGEYIEVNEAFYNLLGFDKDEVIGKTALELGILTDESLKGLMKAIAVRQNESNLEATLRAKNGEIKHVLLSAEIIQIQDKKFRYTVVHDITNRKQAEEMLRESEERFRAVTQSANDAIISANSGGIIIGWNKGAERVFGYTHDEIVGKNLKTIMPQQYAREHTEYIERIIRGGDSHFIGKTVELFGLHKNGNEFPIEISLAAWETASGKFFTGIIRDITRRKLADEEIRRVNNFLDSVIDNIPDMIFIKDAVDFRFVRINRAGENLLGYTMEDLVGKSDYDFFSKEQADSFVEKDREVIRNRVMIDIPEEPIQTRNKGLRILHTQKVPMFNANGEPEYLLGISEDITDLKLAEQARKVSEEKYKTMLNASPDGILLIDLNGIITEASEIGLELFGAISRNDLVGKSAMLFVPSEERDALRDLYEKTMNEGLAQNIELKIRKRNQSLFPAEISTTLIQDPGGNPLSFMIIVRDISQRKKTETKQMHADRMANLGEMASGIAHEINQPLNIISMVMDKILFETAKTASVDVGFLTAKSEKIFENITRIRNIIDHVRAFSRSHDDYVLTAFDINASIENGVSMIAEQFKHLGISLNLDLEKQLPQIFGNTYEFEQVIINLLVNAKDAVIDKKSHQDGFTELIVGIRSYQENLSLIVEVSDNGIGISNDDINHILLPFYTTKDEGKGTGLGLSICYQIIKAMDGTIDIASNMMQGTTVKIVLNIQK
ncbi:MAG: PAS domain S-box protein [Bacteroidetes bacterium]|nr:PAS domain S-box protein [Bacteroidota bacterium]